MAARPRRAPCAVQDLLDLRFHRCRQYRSGDGCAARRLRRGHRAGDAGLPGNRPHRLSGQPVRRRRAAEREPAEGPPAQPDARLPTWCGCWRGRARPRSASVDLATLAARRRRRSRRGSPNSPARASAPPSSTPCSTATSKPSARWRWITGCRSAPPASGSAWRGRWSPRGKVDAARGCGVRRAGRRAGGLPRRELLAGDAEPDRQRRTGRCRCCSSIPTRSLRAGRGAPRAGLGGRATQRRPGPDRHQFDAGRGRSAAVASWPRCSRTRHRAGDGRHRRGSGATPACGGWSSPVAKLQAPWSIAWAFPASSSARKSLQACRFCARVGADSGEMLLALKSGNFGGPEFFSDALRLMR